MLATSAAARDHTQPPTCWKTLGLENPILEAFNKTATLTPVEATLCATTP